MASYKSIAKEIVSRCREQKSTWVHNSQKGQSTEVFSFVHHDKNLISWIERRLKKIEQKGKDSGNQ